MSDELKPCPNRMCRGGKPKMSDDRDSGGCAFVACERCGCSGPVFDYDDEPGVYYEPEEKARKAEAKAHEAWNDLPRDDELRNEMDDVLASAMEAMGDAAQDIMEWRQLGRRWREESADYNFDPKCPTDAGMERTETVLKRIAVARLAIRRFRERRAVDMQAIDPDAEDAPTLRDVAAAVLAGMDKAAAEMIDQGVLQPWRERLRAALGKGGDA